MAKQTVNIGAVANDGTGDQLRNAFDKLNDNFDEVYGNNFVTEAMLNDDIVGAAELKVTGNGTAGQILKSDGDGTFSWINNDEGDLTAIVAGTGLDGTDLSGPIPTINIEDGGVGTTQLADDAVTADKIANAVNTLISNNTAKVTNATHTGDVTGATALTIADDIITNAKLGVEYTASVALTSGTNVAVDTALGDVFTMTAGASHTFNFTNVVIGDMKSLEITGSGGSYTSAFGTVNGSACTFNKIGGTYADTAAKQLIQIKWTATNVAWYQISPIAS
tara:strand:+ start:488 stop:1321 length:834 start_codon:yes stop_codon:yes gene_type:complete